jgi:uncharacterized protein (TIGR02300 family)
MGLKRQCLSCGAKFYDLSKDPILCPKCGTTFEPVLLARSPPRRMGRVFSRAPHEAPGEPTADAAAAPAAEDETETETEKDEDGLALQDGLLDSEA